jgi:amino acid permease
LACGLLTTFGFAVDIGQKAAIFVAYIAYWQPLISTGARVGSIIGFLIAILGLNWFIVPIYGEVEFWLTIFKVTSIIGIIMSAAVISGGGGPAQLLGTNLNYQPVPCAQNQIGQCLSPPGFGCKSFFPKSVLIFSLLEIAYDQAIYLVRGNRSCRCGLLLSPSGKFLVRWQ